MITKKDYLKKHIIDEINGGTDLQSVDVQGLTDEQVLLMIITAKKEAVKNHPTLSENELMALCDLYNGTVFRNQGGLQYELTSSFGEESSYIGKKWDIDVPSLCKKLVNMTDEEAEEVVRRIGAFWLDESLYRTVSEALSDYGQYTFFDFKDFLAVDKTILKYCLVKLGVNAETLYAFVNPDGYVKISFSNNTHNSAQR